MGKLWLLFREKSEEKICTSDVAKLSRVWSDNVAKVLRYEKYYAPEQKMTFLFYEY